MRRLMFVVNASEFFLSHRLPIALVAKAEGYEVHVISPPSDVGEDIRRLGFHHHSLHLSRSGQNPFRELRTLIDLARVLRLVRPDILHLVTIKPVLYGGILARIVGVGAVVAAITGLGTVFNPRSIKERVRKSLVSLLYRVALNQKRLVVIFQNPNDQAIISKLCGLSNEEVAMIRGSGVNLADFAVQPEPKGKPVVSMAARLLRDKGVVEFANAAKILQARGFDVEMRLVGEIDTDNPTSISREELENWSASGCIKVWGHTDDIASVYAESNLVCLPSYHEGLPKGLIEAAASGRAVITTDVPGCRDAIEPGNTGVLVPVGNSEALASAIIELLENPKRRFDMGEAGRKLAEEAFAIEIVVQNHMAIYESLQNKEVF